MDFCLSKTRAGKYHHYRKLIVFKMFSIHTKTKSRVFKFLQFFFLCFRDGFLLTEDITGEAPFRIAPASVDAASVDSALQRMLKTCTKNYYANAQPLLCSENLC